MQKAPEEISGAEACLETRHVLALLPEEPAGRICTSNAGAVSFWATLSWCLGVGVPTGPVLGEPVSDARFCSLIQTEDTALAMCQISCEIRALHGERLTHALDAALRSVTVHAALTGAVLKTRFVRLASPSVAPATLVQELARQLWRADLPVSFGPSWVPVAGADISVGVRGLEETFEAFLREHPAWQMLPRPW